VADQPTRPAHRKLAAWRRGLGIALRAAHLGAVTWLGAALLGAPVPLGQATAIVLSSGAALLLIETLDARLRWNELAGGVSLAKLAVVAWMALDPARAPLLFWVVLFASALSSHAPRRWRHWPRAREA
jgi:hypothetical protein